MSHEFAAASLFNLQGQVAVVTGGGTGLGIMAARALAANGMRVYITGRRKEVLDKAVEESGAFESGGSIVAIQMDVTDRESILAGVKAIEQKEEFISLLVNNAGIAKGIEKNLSKSKAQGVEAYSRAMLDFKEDMWNLVYKTNVASVWYVSGAFLPLLGKAKAASAPKEGASIINLTSISGLLREDQDGQEIYNSSKAALISLTNLMATEFKAPEIGIRVNSIAPGVFPSEMTTSFPSAEDRKAYLDMGYVVGRAGLPSEMAQTVLFLAANHFVHGQHLVIDGGFMLNHR
ncbi:SDR family NAD(P)-dependent oxidoreductase [Rhodotorula paludigena]|uniref:SDR family NAD(P)-dependent oxidoreductase n=1 Tax=Rhodotorula paludigena TaxID=86838 RepID=UPI00318177E7